MLYSEILAQCRLKGTSAGKNSMLKNKSAKQNSMLKNKPAGKLRNFRA
jgi:hypothetical protein